jgi:hypothetical protein
LVHLTPYVSIWLPLETEPACLAEIILERRERGRIARPLADPAVGIAVRQPEYMEMGIATQRRRGEERLDITIDGKSEILDPIQRRAVVLLTPPGSRWP